MAVNSSENSAILEATEKRIAEIEQGEAQAKAAAAKRFNPLEILKSTKEIRGVVDEELGEIRYVFLSSKDFLEISAKYPAAKHPDFLEHNTLINLEIVFRQLAPANPGLTLEDVKALPNEVNARLKELLQGGKASFFPPKQPTPKSSTGSPATPKPK
jgi:hypothetical protein